MKLHFNMKEYKLIKPNQLKIGDMITSRHTIIKIEKKDKLIVAQYKDKAGNVDETYYGPTGEIMIFN
jgi:hypothetical protein